MRQRSQSVALAAAWLLAAACASNPTHRSADGRPLEELERLPYRIAVEPIDQSGSVGGHVPNAAYSFVWRTDAAHSTEVAADREKHDMLLTTFIEGMRRHTAASEVGRSGEVNSPDLVLRPRLAEVNEFGAGKPYKVVGNAALWLTTWWGGVQAPSKKYATRVALDVDVVNPYDGDVVHTFTVRNKSVTLSLAERGRIAQSVVWPPWRSIDRPSRVSRAISERVVGNLAALTTGYLKQEFSSRQQESLGEFKLIRPANFADVGGTPEFEARIVATEMITACDIYLNGSKSALEVPWPKGQFEDAATQREGRRFVLRLPAVRLSLLAGENRVVVEFRVAGRVTSRTFVFFHGAVSE